MFEIEIQRAEKVAVKFLKVDAGVRYWEDADVNGVNDEDGELIPCRSGERWCPLIDLETGIVKDWPDSVTARIHYKVCDDGRYALLDSDGNEVTLIEGYVPDIMCPEGGGFGDYIIMNIDGSGAIENWLPVLDDFTHD